MLRIISDPNECKEGSQEIPPGHMVTSNHQPKDSHLKQETRICLVTVHSTKQQIRAA